MNEPLLERINLLERSVQRWRRISLVLALLLIGAVAVGGASVGMLLIRQDGGGFLLPWYRARAAREDAIRAEQAMRTAEAARQAAEAAKKNGEMGR
jgi:hypothetical protein